jgi:hypothetical protein
LVQLIGRAVVLGAVALVAIGVSGGVAAVFGLVGGRNFVAGDPPGTRYSAARCADYLEYEPHARTCEQAATEHHYGEVVGYRLAVGVLGLFALGAVGLVRRRRPNLVATDHLPVAFDDTVAVIAFGGAALVLLGNGVDQLLLGNDGAGGWLSGGGVAFAATGWFALRFLQRVSGHPFPDVGASQQPGSRVA